MDFILFYFMIKLGVHCVYAESKNTALKEEIQAVTSESRSLANELAEMLLRLEVQDIRAEAVESAVVGDDEKVQILLKEMLTRIQNLENYSNESTFGNSSDDTPKISQSSDVDASQKLEVSLKDYKFAPIQKDFGNDNDNQNHHTKMH